MIADILKRLERYRLPEDVLERVKGLPESAGVSGQNFVIYQSVGIVRAAGLPVEREAAIVHSLYGLTVGLPARVVLDNIRVNRNRPITLALDVEPDDLEVVEPELCKEE